MKKTRYASIALTDVATLKNLITYEHESRYASIALTDVATKN